MMHLTANRKPRDHDYSWSAVWQCSTVVRACLRCLARGRRLDVELKQGSSLFVLGCRSMRQDLRGPNTARGSYSRWLMSYGNQELRPMMRIQYAVLMHVGIRI